MFVRAKLKPKKHWKKFFQENKFGQAGDSVVLEEKLFGEEISLFLLSDGISFLPLAPSQDNKRRFDNNQGPNTGGMGAICPPPVFDQYKDQIDKIICEPLLKALQKEGIEYQGLLYIGVLLHQNKEKNTIEPKVLEFNARFGDPETQAVLLRLDSDLVPALWACTENKLSQIELKWKKEPSCCVVAVAQTYPEKGSNGKAITLPSFSNTNDKNVLVFHAGTTLIDNELVTAGGRILAVSALGSSLDNAAEQAYNHLSNIQFESIDYRKDIGLSINKASVRS